MFFGTNRIILELGHIGKSNRLHFLIFLGGILFKNNFPVPVPFLM